MNNVKNAQHKEQKSSITKPSSDNIRNISQILQNNNLKTKKLNSLDHWIL